MRVEPYILGIDPGINTGWAEVDFATGELHACGLGEPSYAVYHRAIIECPQIYPTTPVKQANDLINLAVRVGIYVERLAESKPVLVLPHAWKGSVPKPAHNRRVLNKLTAAEILTYQVCTSGLAEGKKNNVIDAIGLAKWLFTKSAGTVR